MTYEQVASITQVAALLLFVALFVGVLIYAFWPGNKKRFEASREAALGERSGPRARERRLERHGQHEARQRQRSPRRPAMNGTASAS